MARKTMGQRVAQLEQEMVTLLHASGADRQPWWERVRGVYTDDAAVAEAMRLGRAYRTSLRPAEGKAGAAKPEKVKVAPAAAGKAGGKGNVRSRHRSRDLSRAS